VHVDDYRVPFIQAGYCHGFGFAVQVGETVEEENGVADSILKVPFSLRSIDLSGQVTLHQIQHRCLIELRTIIDNKTCTSTQRAVAYLR
jgi:hypothetical protein